MGSCPLHSCHKALAAVPAQYALRTSDYIVGDLGICGRLKHFAYQVRESHGRPQPDRVTPSQLSSRRRALGSDLVHQRELGRESLTPDVVSSKVKLAQRMEQA